MKRYIERRTRVARDIDVATKEMSGFDLHDRLTQMGLSIPTIFMTGCDDTTSRERVRPLGGKPYLVKPFQDAALIGAIRMALKETR
jgi:FixJ family two-component response regulator